jgi:hypothetical protein
VTVGIVGQSDDDARRAIERRLADVQDAVHAGHLQRLAGYQLDKPKFAKLLSLSTVKAHIAALMRKLDARNRVEIAMRAHESGRITT